MTQTLAILLDAYREINSKKMFWIVLIISAIVVIAFAGTGINEHGITIFGLLFESPYNTTLISKPIWYNYLFTNFGIGFWLTLWGMVLALISTASIIPDLIAGGSIDLYLSRPISRLRLILTKYLCGLLFVALQAAVFSIACFLVIGIRGGVWEPVIFLAIPLVVMVFSFIFCITALLGILTGSVVASLLLSILFWLLVFGVDLAEKGTLRATIAGEIETSAYANQFDYKDKDLAFQKDRLAKGNASARENIDNLLRDRATLEQKKNETDPLRQKFIIAHNVLYIVKSFLPKTSETNSLMDRWLKVGDTVREEKKTLHDERHKQPGIGGWFAGFKDRTTVKVDDAEVEREAAATLQERPVSWILGTSVAFEIAVLCAACWIFARRDY